MAKNTLKGLTIEIGGDTTKLGKALEGVDKKSRDLSKELGEINKLLKLDPENTELLAQKQQVLADAVGNTKEKLETLKEAERQVQAQFEKGEASEEQVRALQREIIATENKLKGYERAVEETSRALDDHGDEAAEAADDVEKLENAEKGADKAGGGLGKTLAGAAAKGLAAVGAAVGAVIAGLTAAAESTREYRAEMGKLETGFDAVGLSAETATATYETLQGVIGETDQSVEAAQQIALLADSEEDAAKWAGLAAGVVGRFGDALQPETFFEAANETLKLGEATGGYTQMLEQAGYDVEKFNKGLAKCKTESEKQAYMLKITEGVLGEAANKYRETNEEVIRANQANEQWTQSLAGVGGAVEPVITDVKMLGASLLSDLVPGVQSITDAFRGLMNGEDGSAEALGAALSGIITDLVNKVVEMAPTLVSVAMSLISTLAESLLLQLPLILDTLLMIVGNIAQSLGEMLPTLIPLVIDTVLMLTETLLDNVDMLIDAGIALLVGLADGLIEALPRLIERLPVIIDKTVTALSNNMPKLIRAGIQLTVKLAEGLIKAIPQLVSKLPEIISSIVEGFKSYYSEIGEIGSDLIKGLWNGIKDMSGWIGKKIKGFGQDVLGGLKDFFGIKSPSRVFRDVIGKNLALGLAEGIEDNADAPLDAMTSLGDDLMGAAGALNGLTLERQLNHTFSGSGAAEQTGMLAKLDSILAAIERGQILTIDGDALVGATAGKMDNTLGQRRALAARGAL